MMRLARCAGWLLLSCGTALLSPLMMPALALATPTSAGVCEQQRLSALRPCSDREAVAITGRAGWVACAGRCVIVHDDDAVSIMSRQRGEVARVEDARFLAGAGNTRDLRRLPLLAADQHLVLIDPETFQAVGRLSLARLTDGEPAQLPRFVDEAHLSTDGRRFFIPSPDGAGFSAYEIAGDRLVPLLPADPVIVISPSGRYGLTVRPDGDGTYTLRDYVSGASWRTTFRFDVDQVFFDVDEQHLLWRHRHMAGSRLSVYRLAGGAPLGTLAWPETGGMAIRIGSATQGVTAVDALPALD